MMRARLIVLATLAALVVVGTVALASVALAAPGAPTVVRIVPPNGATDVDPDANIKAKFSETMKATTINTTTFNLYQGHLTGCPAAGCIEDPIPATVRYNAQTRTAILDPTSSLRCNTEYTAMIEGTGDGDMQAVKDRGGTPMARDYIWHFTTGVSGGPNPCPF
jgi:hypothetical protein